MARQNSTMSTLARVESTQERGRARARPPAALLLGASHAVAAEASRTRVVCRSAPASRAGSRVREEPGSVRGLKKDTQKKSKAQSPLPSPPAVVYPLPRARGSNTQDSSRRRRGPARRKGDRATEVPSGVSLSLHGHAEGEQFEWSSGASDSSESEGMGREVDLGMLLRAGSPRRQASVQSLRRHLSMSSRGAHGEENSGKKRRGLPREWADGD